MKDRIYLNDDDEQYYYRARGNHTVGPFETRQQAQHSLDRLTRKWTTSAGQKYAWLRPLQAARILRRSASRHT